MSRFGHSVRVFFYTNLIICLFLVTPQAKKACFISFGSFILCFANGSSLMALYLYKAISAPDGIEIDVLLLFSFATIIGNVLFSCVVDLISRKVWGGLEIFFWSKLNEEIVIFPFLCVCLQILYVFSAFFTMLSFLLLTIYIHMNRLDFEYICLTCFACITLFSNMGLRQMPLIVSNEVLPKKVWTFIIIQQIKVNWQLTCATVILINFQIVRLKSIANIFDSLRFLS